MVDFSIMKYDKLTVKAQDALNEASALAQRNDHGQAVNIPADESRVWPEVDRFNAWAADPSKPLPAVPSDKNPLKFFHNSSSIAATGAS